MEQTSSKHALIDSTNRQDWPSMCGSMLVEKYNNPVKIPWIKDENRAIIQIQTVFEMLKTQKVYTQLSI